MPGEQGDLVIGRRIIKPNTDTARHSKPSPVRRVLYLYDGTFTKACFGTVGQPPSCVILAEGVGGK